MSARCRRNALVPSGRRKLAGVTISAGGSSARQNESIAVCATRSRSARRSAVLCIRSVLLARAASARRFHLVHVERRSDTASTLTLASCCSWSRFSWSTRSATGRGLMIDATHASIGVGNNRGRAFSPANQQLR